MKRFLATVALAIPMMATPVVTYTTQGVFGVLPGTTETQPGSGLTFTGTPNILFGGGTVDLTNPPHSSFANFGFFNTAALLGAIAPVDVSGPFVLRINQTGGDVAPGSHDFIAAITGSISGTAAHPGSSSNAKITFAGGVTDPSTGDTGPIAIINGVKYQLSHDVYLISAPTAGQITSINGTISTAGVPEPGTIGLMGLGLVAVGLIARRRRA